jgi:threonine/homoserine/homoserine lactone efflux protein
MAAIADFWVFLLSVMFVSLSGVLLPGPLFAVTIEKAAKRKTAGALIAIGHGVIEFPLMFLIFFVLSEFQIPMYVQVAIGIVGGVTLMFMGLQTFRNRNKTETQKVNTKQDSLLAGIRTTAFNPGFHLWWLTVGTALVLNAKLFGLIGFSIFAAVHWSCDFLWYTIVAFLIYKSHKFWTAKVNQAILLFCVGVLVGFGAYFFGTALYQAFTMPL